MYKLEEFVSLFNSIPLPYKVIQIPKYGLPPAQLDFSPGVFKHLMKTDDLSIDCLTNSGFHVESNAMISHILIGRRFTQEKINTLNDFQKCSHFYGTHLIGAKDGFNYRMKELQQRLGYPAPFYPLCLFPPDDYEELLKIWPTKPYWIIKAPALSRAREIRLASSKDEEAPKLPFIIEEYISPPYLITGRKFDVRFYALVTSINPLIIYYHHHGLVLFATHQYNDKIENIKDLKIHLTNYEVNKDSETYIKSDDLTEKVENSKWSLPFLWNYFESIGIDSKKLKKEMEDASTAAIIAGMCSLRNLHNSNIKFHRKSSFELLGIDILLDQNLKPYILEINISPSMQASSELDRMMKGELLHDTYNIVRMLQVCSLNRNEYSGYYGHENCYFNAKKTVEPAVLDGTINPWESPTFSEYTIIREFIEEQDRRRGFYRAYPRRKNIETFSKCFDHYVYEDIVLNKWLQMDKQQRFEVLLTNFDLYYNQMQQCYKMRDNPPPLPQDQQQQNSQKRIPEKNPTEGETKNENHNQSTKKIKRDRTFSLAGNNDNDEYEYEEEDNFDQEGLECKIA